MTELHAAESTFHISPEDKKSLSKGKTNFYTNPQEQLKMFLHHLKNGANRRLPYGKHLALTSVLFSCS